MKDHIKYDKLILWAGCFGNGIQDVIDPTKLTEKEVVLCYGRKDEFLVKSTLNSMKKIFKSDSSYADSYLRGWAYNQ